MRWICFLLLFAWLQAPWVALADGGYSAEELDKLAGPIALYPDPLLNTVVAAAATPDQVQAAQSAAQQGVQEPDSSWEDSVKALYAYPDVMSMMVKNPDWTQAVGWAGVNQPNEFMDAVQRFRYQAQTAGNLQTNDKVQVIEEGTTVRIEPANPEVIYVPSYQPQTVIVEDDDPYDEVIGWGVGVATGALLWSSMYHWGSGCWYHPPYGWRPGAGYYHPYGWQNAGIYNRNNMWNRNTNINRPININNINTGNIIAGNRPGNRPGAGNRPGDRPGVGNRPGDRPGVGSRPGDRPGVGNRPGDRPGVGNRPGDRPGMGSERPGMGNRPSVSPRPADRPSVSQPGWGNQGGLGGSRPSFPSQRPSFPSSMPSGGFSGGGFQNRPSGGFSSQRPSGGFSSQRPSGGFSSQRPSGGFSSQRPSGGFSSQRSSGFSNYSRSGSTSRASSRGSYSGGSRSYSGGSRGGGGGRRR